MLTVGGADCHALRCAFLHSGHVRFSGNSAKAAIFERVIFTSGQVGSAWATRTHPSTVKPVLQYSIEDLCQEMTTAARVWYRSRKGDQRVMQAVRGLLSLTAVR